MRLYNLKLLKCIWNENFDIGFFAFSENLVFSDHKNTSLRDRPSILWGAWFAAGRILAGTGGIEAANRAPHKIEGLPRRL
jgi:hypothetical protein